MCGGVIKQKNHNCGLTWYYFHTRFVFWSLNLSLTADPRIDTAITLVKCCSGNTFV